jgi:hypothetical protein
VIGENLQMLGRVGGEACRREISRSAAILLTNHTAESKCQNPPFWSALLSLNFWRNRRGDFWEISN